MSGEIYKLHCRSRILFRSSTRPRGSEPPTWDINQQRHCAHEIVKPYKRRFFENHYVYLDCVISDRTYN